MTHDKFCTTVTKGIPGIVAFPDYLCNCEDVAAIRADEREQAAQRVEHFRHQDFTYPDGYDSKQKFAFVSGFKTGVIGSVNAVRGGEQT